MKNNEVIIRQAKEAAEKVGVAPISVWRAMKANPSKSALWCAYYALSGSFACNPPFVHEQRVNYATKMVREVI